MYIVALHASGHPEAICAPVVVLLGWIAFRMLKRERRQ